MGIIYAFTSRSKPWVKLGKTINCPVGRIEDYNQEHGTDFAPDSLISWVVPDCVCLAIEQKVHAALEVNDFDRVRKGSANEIFTFAGRKETAFIEVVRIEISIQLKMLLAEVELSLRGVDVVNPEVLDLDDRDWAVFLCPECSNKLSAPLDAVLRVTCPGCGLCFFAKLSIDSVIGASDICAKPACNELVSSTIEATQPLGENNHGEDYQILSKIKLENLVKDVVRYRENGLVWWFPKGENDPVLTAVRAPVGTRVTESNWIALLAFRVQQMMDNSPEPGREVKNAAKLMNDLGYNNLAWGPARSAGQILVTENTILLQVMRMGNPGFPINVTDEFEVLLDQLNLMDINSWVEAAVLAQRTC